MLAPSAIRAFLERDRRDFNVYKKLTDAELQRRADALPVFPPIWHKLTRTQKICFLIGAEQKRFLFLLDTGEGKTLLAIALTRYFQKLGILKQVLVLVPNLVNKGEWADEIEKHSQAGHMILDGSSVNKWAQVERSDNSTFVIETYGGFLRMVCDKVPRKKKGGEQLQPNRARLVKIVARFGGLIMDESTLVKTKDKLPFRVCRAISNKADVIFGLTGTPFGRDPTDLWGQFFLVDHGHTLGETLGLFRAAFFREVQTPWRLEYKFEKKKEPLLHRFMANASIRFEADEALMPRCVIDRKYVVLPQDTEVYYERVRDAIIAAHGNYREMKNAFVRMRQISSGWLGYEDDESGEKASFEFPDNPKMDMLMSYVERINPAHKIMVVHDFIHSGVMIARELAKAKVKHVCINGKEKDTDASKRTFKEDPACRVLVINTAGAYGLNLQVAKYGLVYESPVSVILRKQIERRFIRQYSEHKTVFLTDFLVRYTVDDQILQFHQEGADLFAAIVNGQTKPSGRAEKISTRAA